MNVSAVGGTWLGAAPVATAQAQPAAPASPPACGDQTADFAGHLSAALGEVNQMQVEANHQAELLATGQAPDLLGAVVAVEQAQLALQLTVAVTNRAVEAYKEISRMQL